MLNDTQIAQFVETGYVRLDAAFPRATADACRRLAADQLGIDESDPASWTLPVVRGPVDGQPLHDAANSVRLLGAISQLLAGEKWILRSNLGAFVVRFPSDGDPGDAGWHIDSSYQRSPSSRPDEWFVNHRSRGRGLLLLCLVSDVEMDDAPTKVLPGSHRLLPELLRPFGDDGVLGSHVPLPDTTGPVEFATGEAGDVYLCHPFLVHAATWPHRGTAPRFISQPPISLDGDLNLDTAAGPRSPAALAVDRVS